MRDIPPLHLPTGDTPGKPRGFTARQWGERAPHLSASARFRAAHAVWGGGRGDFDAAALRELFALLLRMQAAAEATAVELARAHPLAGAPDDDNVHSPVVDWARQQSCAVGFTSNVSAFPTMLYTNSTHLGEPWAMCLPPSFAEVGVIYEALFGESLPPFAAVLMLASLHWRTTAVTPDPVRHVAGGGVPRGWTVMTATMSHDD